MSDSKQISDQNGGDNHPRAPTSARRPAPPPAAPQPEGICERLEECMDTRQRGVQWMGGAMDGGFRFPLHPPLRNVESLKSNGHSNERQILEIKHKIASDYTWFPLRPPLRNVEYGWKPHENGAAS